MPDLTRLPGGESCTVETIDDSEVEVLLISALSLFESSEPYAEINLGLLTSVEKRMLLTLLCQQLGFVRDIARRFLGGVGLELPEREMYHAV